MNDQAPYPTQPYLQQYPTPPFPGDAGPSWPPAGSPGGASGTHQPWQQGSPPGTGWWGPPPPPHRRPSRVGVVVAAIVVVLAVVSGALMYTSIPMPDPVPETTPATTAPVAPPESSPAAVTDVSFTITDNLASYQAAESVTVYSLGKEVGTLRISSSSPTDELTVTGEPGEVDYQLQIVMVLTDEYGGHQVTLTGSGTITAYEEARYYVDVVKDSSGTWVAALTTATST